MLKYGVVLLLVVLVRGLPFGIPSSRPNSCYEDGMSRLHNERFNKGCMTCDCIDGKVECFDSEWLCQTYKIAAGCKAVPNPKKHDGTGKHCCKAVVCEPGWKPLTREPSGTSWAMQNTGGPKGASPAMNYTGGPSGTTMAMK